MFKFAYCQPCIESNASDYEEICKEFVRAVMDNFPDYKKKAKIHLLLHLPDDVIDFGPTSTFNTER